jgi:hypothetical protein
MAKSYLNLLGFSSEKSPRERALLWCAYWRGIHYRGHGDDELDRRAAHTIEACVSDKGGPLGRYWDRARFMGRYQESASVSRGVFGGDS